MTVAQKNGLMLPVRSGSHHFEEVLSYASALIAEETDALRSYKPFEHAAFAARKSMMAFELEALFNNAELGSLGPGALRHLELLRSGLQENQALLEIHMSASREIAGILQAIIRTAESDGTYSVRPGGRGTRT